MRNLPVSCPIPSISDYIKELFGTTKNIGLGSDFDGVPMIAKGLEDVSRLSNLTKALVGREYTDSEIKGILGDNFLGYMKKILR